MQIERTSEEVWIAGKSKILICAKQFLSKKIMLGEGPFLKLFSKEGDLLSWDEVLPFGVVHGIRPLLLQHGKLILQ